MDYTVHGILQARIPEWIVISFSRGSSQSRDWTQVSCIAGRFFTSSTTREAQKLNQGFLSTAMNESSWKWIFQPLLRLQVIAGSVAILTETMREILNQNNPAKLLLLPDPQKLWDNKYYCLLQGFCDIVPWDSCRNLLSIHVCAALKCEVSWSMGNKSQWIQASLFLYLVNGSEAHFIWLLSWSHRIKH